MNKVLNNLIFITYFLLSVSQVFAQNKSGRIEIRKGLLGTYYYTNGNRFTPKWEIIRIVSINEEALKEVKMARKNLYPALLTGVSGGPILIIGLFEGWINITGISKDKIPNVPLLITSGIVLTGISIHLGLSYSKHVKNAVIIYNKGLESMNSNRIDINIGVISNGVGLRINF
jgi:hypothetical protein